MRRATRNAVARSAVPSPGSRSRKVGRPGGEGKFVGCGARVVAYTA